MEQSIKSVLVKQGLAQQQPINNLQVSLANMDVFWGNVTVLHILPYVHTVAASVSKVGCECGIISISL